MLCECISVWSEEFNGAECADLWHCGASTWQTEEKPEPARNEVVWAGVIICPAAWADSLFRDLKWSSCNGVCGPDYRWGSCSAMWYCTLSTIWKCAIPHFLKSSLRSALMLSSPLLLIAFVVFWILNYFLTEESYFHCSILLTYGCFTVLTNLDSASFSSVRKGGRPGLTSRIGRASVHICPGIEFIFLVASTVLCFVFRMKQLLVCKSRNFQCPMFCSEELGGSWP